jgi:hypothetical protein
MAATTKPLVPHVPPTEEQRSEGKVGVCRDCETEWPERLFVSRLDRCLNCAREYARLAQEKRRGVDKLHKLYGLPLDEQRSLREAGCAICSAPESSLSRKLNADHDHKTGEFRGFLCSPCNFGLGFFRDSADRMRSAIRYLEEHSKREPRKREYATDPAEKLIESRLGIASAVLATALEVEIVGGKVVHSWNDAKMGKLIAGEAVEEMPSDGFGRRPIRSLSEALDLVGSFRSGASPVRLSVGQVWVDAQFAWRITKLTQSGAVWLERLDGKRSLKFGGESALRRFLVYDPARNR